MPNSHTNDAHNRVILHTDSGDVMLDPHCFLIFIDETGHEMFADKNYPLFGFGGCGILARDYVRLIRKPWKMIKEMHFESEHTPLHAKNLYRPSPTQVKALSDFFETYQFCRMATIITDKVALTNRVVPFEVTGANLLNQIEKLGYWQPVNSIAIIFESSQRNDFLTTKFFHRYNEVRITPNSSQQTFTGDIQKFFMSKSVGEAGLEVANFVIHTAGTQVQACLKEQAKYERKDFVAVFKRIGKKFSDFIQITDVKVNNP